MNFNEINISTERLILRGIKASDAESMFKYRSNPQIYKFQSWKPQTLEEVKEFIYEKPLKFRIYQIHGINLGFCLRN